MRRIIVCLSFVLLGYGTGVQADQQNGKIFPVRFESSIIEDVTTRNVKRTVRVEINQPISERRIRTMARAIKDDRSLNVERMWIWFQFPSPMSSGGAWTTVSFEGDKLVSVQFNGPTREQILDAYWFKDDPDRDVKQVWISFDNPGERIVFFVEDDLFYFERRYLSNLLSSATTVNRITASSLPLNSWGRFMSEDDKDYNEFLGFDRHWIVDDDNMLKRMDGDKLAYTAYPIISGKSRFPTVQTKRVSDDDLCRQNLQCWGRRHEILAKAQCTVAVEYVLDGATAYEWTDGWLESKFSRFIWKPGKNKEGILIYLGDSMKVQNVNGGWTPVRYECEFDPNIPKVLDVRIK